VRRRIRLRDQPPARRGRARARCGYAQCSRAPQRLLDAGHQHQRRPRHYQQWRRRCCHHQLARGETAVTTVQATDQDAGSQISYRISGGTDAALFTINASTGALRFIQSPEAGGGQNSYNVIVEASDNNKITGAPWAYQNQGNPGGPLTDTQNLTIVVNSPPTLTAPAALAYTDTAADDSFQNQTGTLSASDPDQDSITYGLSGATAGSTVIGGVTYDLSKAGSHGTLYLSSTTGQYVYVPNDAAIEALKAGASENFTVSATAGGDTATQSLAVNITGVNDTPTLATPAAVALTDTVADDSFTTQTGTLSATDRDNDTLSYGITGGTDNGTTVSLAGIYGTLTVTKATGAYSYVPVDAVIEALNANGNESFTVTASDGLTSDSKTLAINIAAVADTNVSLNVIAAGIGGFVINGQASNDLSGYSVASAGDVNGDGLDDLIVGAYLSDPAAGGAAGRSYVVFGKTGGTEVDLSAVAAGVGGFVINGQASGDASGRPVASAGDVNGDGLADLIVGASQSDPAAGGEAGRSYVVFGKSTTTEVNLSAVATGSGGFVINGQAANERSGISVASAGDVNGDGMVDLIVGANQSNSFIGRSYVVFGQTGTTAVDLSAVLAGNGGFVINGEAVLDRSGSSVASAGDVNGDGLADLIVGSPPNTPPGSNQYAGRSYVVFGKTGGTEVNLSAVAAGAGGFVINGQGYDDLSGSSVASAGDVNGDGLADLIVGALRGDPAAGDGAGLSYVVFGKTGTAAIDLSAVAAGSGGFVINGQSSGDQSGISVASAGDVNGDGLADLIVGAYQSSTAAGGFAGRSYVVFGKTGTTAIDLSAVAAGSGGFVVNGQSAGDLSGYSVASAGDVNGDGLADLIVGAYQANTAGGTDAGRSYVIFGSTTGAFSQTAFDQVGGAGAETLTGTAGTDNIAGGDGNDTLIGNGGTDVLYGGRGNDVFQLNASNIAALSAGVTSGTLARIDGGSGIDTIALAGSGINFNLANVSNIQTGSRIESVERIDLTGSGNNTLGLQLRDVLDITGLNNFNSTNGWTGLGATVQRHQVVVDGNSGDALNLDSGWVLQGGTASNGGNSYAVYNHSSSAAQVLVDTDVLVTLPLPVINLSAVAAGSGGFVINGQAADDRSGFSVASAGDVNGDGLADLIVGAYASDPAAGSNAGRSYVVFGKSSTTEVNLSAVAAGSGGFVINGQSAGDQSGISVASAGDVNGDGLADLVVGAHASDPAAGVEAGRSYVVFGKNSGAEVNLSAIATGSGGFVINGQASNDLSGIAVASAGDVNGDGLADLIVGADSSDPAAGADAGRSYVVFGQTGGTEIHLSAVAVGSGGFVINGQAASDTSGHSVASAGDVNGDGLADLIVGAYFGSPAAGIFAGRSYVVFGKSSGAEVNLSAVAAGSGGFVINGQSEVDLSGVSVASAGDVNGDGLADLIVGADSSDPAAGGEAGRSYVVFGKTGTTAIDLSAVAAGSGGFVINGQAVDDESGGSVASAGDVNGDGLADLIVGAYFGDPAAGADAGRSYVVFGKTGTAEVNLSAVAAGSGGFVINGQAVDDLSGGSVASAGDVNGDGLADLIVGAHQSDPAAGSAAGRSYVIFGSTTGAFSQTAFDQVGGAGAETLTGTAGTDNIAGGDGNDTLIGNGGTDVLYGGRGNDVFQLNASNISALSAGVTGGTLARIDGGSGIDTLALVGSGITLDLAAVSNTQTGSRIESVERIDLTGSGNNTLELQLRDVLDMVGMNSFNSGNGWSGLAAAVNRHQLVVDGNAGDALVLGSGWVNAGVATNNGNSYTVYNHSNSAAEVLVIALIGVALDDPDLGAF